MLAGLTASLPGTAAEWMRVEREHIQRAWDKTEGLPDSQVQAIRQTRDSQLWIATRRGLARFDGLKFTVFNHLNTPEMPDDNCQSLAEDGEGNLWIATEDGLLQWRDWRFERFTTKDGLGHNQILVVHADQLGDLWVATQQGLQRRRNGTFVACRDERGEMNQTILALHQDGTGVMWAGGAAGYLRRFDGRTGRFAVEPGLPGLKGDVAAIEGDGAGGLWLLCSQPPEASGLYRLRHGGLEKIPADFAAGFRKPFLHFDRRGRLWLATGQGGFDSFKDGQFTRYPLAPEFADDFVLNLTEDRKGNLWLGTEASGLQCWKPKAVAVLSTRDGLVHDNTWSLCEARDGSIWIGTDEGVSQYQAGRVRNFTPREGLSGNRVRSVAEDASGAIWVGTDNGLNVIRNGSVTQQPFPHRPELNKIRVVYPANNGALWVGTVAGLFRLEAGEWTTFTPAQGLAQADQFGDVRALREDQAGNLWIGTYGGGLQRWRDGTFDTFTKTNGLANNFVWALHADAEGVLWIGTESGLNRYEDGRFTTYTTREGLPVNLINEILEDQQGNLWVSHDHGIYRVRKWELNEIADGRMKSVRAVRYTEADGLPSIETNGQKSQPAGCRSRDGRLWFPTTKGVAIIDPKRCEADDVAPLAVVEQVRADGKVLFSNAGPAAPADTPVHSTKTAGSVAIELRLPAGSGRVLEFRYTAPAFTAPERTAFQYRLLGAGDVWIEAATRREAYFMRLRPGRYLFDVMAANHHGVWGQQSALVAFTIEPFFYQTWWFYASCGLAVTGLAAGVVGWRLRKLRRIHRLEQQSAIVEERTRIAKDLHDGLGADLTRLALLADLAGGESGTEEHLQKLSRTSREAARVLKEMIWIANPANDTVEGLVSRICQTAEDFLGDAHIRCRLEIASDLPAWALTIEQRRNLLLVAREALNNIVKHAAATEVILRAYGDGQLLQLDVEDNGRSFDPAAVRPSALGLASMKRRVENLGGAFEIQSRSDTGTRIRITVKPGNTDHAQSRR